MCGFYALYVASSPCWKVLTFQMSLTFIPALVDAGNMNSWTLKGEYTICLSMEARVTVFQFHSKSKAGNIFSREQWCNSDQATGHFLKEDHDFALISFKAKQFCYFMDMYIKLLLCCLRIVGHNFFFLESPNITLEIILYIMNMYRFDIPGS